MSTRPPRWGRCGQTAVTCAPGDRAVEGSVQLSDGRSLDLFDWGARDAPVVFYCHGTPGSRFELSLAEPGLVRNQAAIRLIALNRPGYGTSTLVQSAGFLSWARDVGEVADLMGFDRFAVLGASGGSPYALACAHSLGERVTRVGIVAGVAPPDTPGMAEAATLTAEYASKPARSLRYGLLSLAVRSGLTGRLVEKLIDSLGAADRQALSNPRATGALARVVQEGFSQWGKAAALEGGLFMRPWEFDPAGIQHEVRFWHGSADTRIPSQVPVAMLDRIPNSTCVLWPQHGHFSWASSGEIVSVIEFLVRD